MSKFATQDPKVVSVFEIVGSYFVDCLFNHIYASARANLASGASLADEYTRRVQAYVMGVKNDETCYERTLQGVHQYFATMTGNEALTYAGFADQVVGVSVPEAYRGALTTQDKDELLSSIICDLVSSTAAFATTADMLARIVGSHERAPRATIRQLQDSAVGALLASRTALHNKFLRKAGQADNRVAAPLLEDMKAALRQLVKDKAEAVARAEDLEARLRTSRSREAKLLKLVKLLQAGHKSGPAVAGTALRARQRETTAEDPLDLRGKPAHAPRRETTAERDAGDEDEEDEEDEDEEDEESEGGEEDEEDEGDEEDEEDEDYARRPTRAKTRATGPKARVPEKPQPKKAQPKGKPGKGSISTGGQKGAPPPAVTPGFFRRGALPLSAAAAPHQPSPAVAPTAVPPVRAKPPPALMSLMSGVVDADEQPDEGGVAV